MQIAPGAPPNQMIILALILITMDQSQFTRSKATPIVYGEWTRSDLHVAVKGRNVEETNGSASAGFDPVIVRSVAVRVDHENSEGELPRSTNSTLLCIRSV